VRRLRDVLFGARAQVALGALMVIGFTVAWPVTALTTFRHEPQGILGLSFIALIIGGYNIVATGLGYRKTEHVEAQVVENIEEAENVAVTELDDATARRAQTRAT
jgi:hypothetical protein